MTNGRIITIIGICSLLRIGSRPVSSAIGSVTVEVLRVRDDHAGALAGVGLMLFHGLEH